MPQKATPKGVQRHVLDVMTHHIGMHMTIEAVTAEVEFDHRQVGSALYHLSKKGIINRRSSGVYVYRPTPEDDQPINGNHNSQPASQLFETIGLIADLTVVRSDDGQLYVLKPLSDFLTPPLLTVTSGSNNPNNNPEPSRAHEPIDWS